MTVHARWGLAQVALLMSLWVAAFALPVKGDESFELPLANPSFGGAVHSDGIPSGWSRYGGGGKQQELKIVDGPGGSRMLLIADGDPATEIGVSQRFRLKGGETYQVSAKVRSVNGASTAGALSGRPVRMETLDTPSGSLTVLATDRGAVAGYPAATLKSPLGGGLPSRIP